VSGARVQLLGRLLADPELCFTPTGEAAARFELVSSAYGPTEVDEVAMRHLCLAWNQGGRRLADLVVDHLQAGDVVYVEGRLQAPPRRAFGDRQAQSLNVLVWDLQLLEPSQEPAAGRRRRRRTGL